MLTVVQFSGRNLLSKFASFFEHRLDSAAVRVVIWAVLYGSLVEWSVDSVGQRVGLVGLGAGLIGLDF